MKRIKPTRLEDLLHGALALENRSFVSLKNDREWLRSICGRDEDVLVGLQSLINRGDLVRVKRGVYYHSFSGPGKIDDLLPHVLPPDAIITGWWALKLHPKMNLDKPLKESAQSYLQKIDKDFDYEQNEITVLSRKRLRSFTWNGYKIRYITPSEALLELFSKNTTMHKDVRYQDPYEAILAVLVCLAPAPSQLKEHLPSPRHGLHELFQRIIHERLKTNPRLFVETQPDFNLFFPAAWLRRMGYHIETAWGHRHAAPLHKHTNRDDHRFTPLEETRKEDNHNTRWRVCW